MSYLSSFNGIVIADKPRTARLVPILLGVLARLRVARNRRSSGDALEQLLVRRYQHNAARRRADIFLRDNGMW